MSQGNVDVGRRWLRGGENTSLVQRLRDALPLAEVIVAGVLSRRPVRPLGDESRRPLPGDGLVAGALQWTHGVTIRARPADIWPWLVQLGCRRAGWYSYDRLDNDGVPSADRIVPELQHVEVGDILPWTPTADDGFVVRAVERERALVLGDDAGWLTWALVLQPIDDTSTRLLAVCGFAPPDKTWSPAGPPSDSYGGRYTSVCSDGSCSTSSVASRRQHGEGALQPRVTGRVGSSIGAHPCHTP